MHEHLQPMRVAAPGSRNPSGTERKRGATARKAKKTGVREPSPLETALYRQLVETGIAHYFVPEYPFWYLEAGSKTWIHHKTPNSKGRKVWRWEETTKERLWRFDFAAPAFSLAVECDGGSFSFGRHNRGVGAARDSSKLNEAAIRGWRVLRFDFGMIKQGVAIETIQRAMR